MYDLLSLINKNIREEFAGPVLSKFDFLSTSEDELDEGNETEHHFADDREGIEITCDSLYLIKVIFLYSGKQVTGNALRYRHELISGLVFEDSRDKVLRALGTPATSGGPHQSRSLHATGGFDRYDYTDWSIHFEYLAAADQIALVTVMASDVVP